MFEFHGWAVVRLTRIEEDRGAATLAIGKAVDAARSDFSKAEVAGLGNDLTVVYVHGVRNHRATSIERLFEVVAEHAPASYGLLYLRDDEDKRGGNFANGFRVWRLARGEFIEMDDPFLSPYMRSVEEPYAGPYPCPCCGYMVFDEAPGSYDICPICFWEDDLAQLRFPDMSSGPNHTSLIDAQATFRRTGASEERLIGNVRAPNATDRRDPDWRAIDATRDHFEKTGVPGASTSYPDDSTVLYYWRDNYWRRADSS